MDGPASESGQNPRLEPGGHGGVRPFRASLMLALTYLFFTSAYIWISGRMVAAIARDVQELQRLESIKGQLFMILSAGLIFLISYRYLREVRKAGERVVAQQRALGALEQRATAGDFASSVAHDINNVLVSAMAEVEEMEERVEKGNHTGVDVVALRRLDAALADVRGLSRRLASLGHRGLPGEVAPIDLKKAIEEVVRLAGSHHKVRCCKLEFDWQCDLARVCANSEILKRTILNLILNAADATDRCGRIQVLARSGESRVIIEVNDDGPGVDPAKRDLIFQPFYTTKRDGNGLGLLSARACAEMHGGQIEVDSSPLGGACFRLVLPLASPA